MKQKRYIGVTFLFIRKEEQLYQAIQSSYIVEMKGFADLKKDITTLSEDLIISDFKDYSYLGVCDLYIADNQGEANFLGRTSFYEDKDIKQAQSYLLNKEKLKEAFSETKAYEKSNLGLVYFHEDPEGSEYNSTMIIYTLIENKKDLNSVLDIGESKAFKQVVCDFSIEQLYIDSLKFVGISELYKIKNKGLFERIAEFENLSEVEEEILNDKALEARFGEVFEDYQSF